jgi:hypothetical protein
MAYDGNGSNSVGRVETRVELEAYLARLAELRVQLESQLEPTRVEAEFNHVYTVKLKLFTVSDLYI